MNLNCVENGGSVWKMIPVRCFSCGKVLRQEWTTLSVAELAKRNVVRSCCVRMCIASVDICQEQLRFAVVARQTRDNGGILPDPDDEKRNHFREK